MSFKGDLSGFAQRTGIKFDKIVRKVVIDMTKEIVMATPVDTGLARSNWFWGYQPITGIIDRWAIKKGDASIARAANFAGGLKAGGVFYLTNNVPYIMRLEYGSSKQAPSGMARITVARWQAIVDKAVRL